MRGNSRRGTIGYPRPWLVEVMRETPTSALSYFKGARYYRERCPYRFEFKSQALRKARALCASRGRRVRVSYGYHHMPEYMLAARYKLNHPLSDQFPCPPELVITFIPKGGDQHAGE